MKESNNNTLPLLVLAGMIGAAAALLFAPSSGRETREKLKTTARTAKNKTQDQMQAAKEFTADKFEQAKTKTQDVKNALKKTDANEINEMEEI